MTALMFQLEFDTGNIGNTVQKKSSFPGASHLEEGDEYTVKTSCEAVESAESKMKRFRKIRIYVPDNRMGGRRGAIYLNRDICTDNYVVENHPGVKLSVQRQVLRNVNQKDPLTYQSAAEAIGPNVHFRVEAIIVLGDGLDHSKEIAAIKTRKVMFLKLSDTQRQIGRASCRERV